MSSLDEAVLKKQVIAAWESEPLNRPVKITSIVRDPMFWTEGFITSYKFIAGRSLNEAEGILGLKSGDLLAGAYMYEFMRLPTADEFELKGYSQCPDGKNWQPESEYPAGKGAPQWRVKPNTYIASRLAAIVDPGGTFK
jgi:hypothetical protein